MTTTRTGSPGSSTASQHLEEALAVGLAGALGEYFLELIDREQHAAAARLGERREAGRQERRGLDQLGAKRLDLRLALGIARRRRGRGQDNAVIDRLRHAARQRADRIGPGAAQSPSTPPRAQPRDHAGVQERRLAGARRPDDRQLGRVAQPLDERVDLELAAEVEPRVLGVERGQPAERPVVARRVARTVNDRAVEHARPLGGARPQRGSRSSDRVTSSTTAAGTSRRSAVQLAIRAASRAAARRASGSSPSGWRPVSSCAVRMPSAHESTRSVTRTALHCSGAIQSGVPDEVLAAFSPVRATPKSTTRTRPSLPTITLLGLRSQ